MPMHDPERLKLLSERLSQLDIRADGPFRQPEEILEALRHSSYASEKGLKSNERLEMLGDSVLDFLVTDLLFELFADEPEGVLTRLRASLVDEPALAGQASRLELGELLALGKGEELSGGRERPSMLADVFEAVFAALYRSEGLDVVRQLCRVLFLDEAKALLHDAPQPTDYKTILQVQTQGEWKLKPNYQIVSESGPDHERSFVAQVYLRSMLLGEGSGPRKRSAEQKAAKAALEDWDALKGKVWESLKRGKSGESTERKTSPEELY